MKVNYAGEAWEVVDQAADENIETILVDEVEQGANTEVVEDKVQVEQDFVDAEKEDSTELDQGVDESESTISAVMEQAPADEEKESNVVVELDTAEAEENEIEEQVEEQAEDQDIITIVDEQVGNEEVEDDRDLEDNDSLEETEDMELLDRLDVNWLQEFEKILGDYRLPSSFKVKPVERKSSSGKVKTVLVVGGGILVLGLAVGGFVVYRKRRRRSRAEALPVKEELEVKEPEVEPEPVPEQSRPHCERIPRPFFYFG